MIQLYKTVVPKWVSDPIRYPATRAGPGDLVPEAALF